MVAETGGVQAPMCESESATFQDKHIEASLEYEVERDAQLCRLIIIHESPPLNRSKGN